MAQNMKKQFSRLLTPVLALSMTFSLFAVPAWALEYDYEGDQPGETWHQSTSTDQNHNAENGNIVVGSDGTVSSGTTGNQTSGPLTSVDLPVGEYPEAWNFETDVDIAGNSVFPNELGPTTQNSNYYRPTFIPTVESGSLPTGNSYTYNYSAAASLYAALGTSIFSNYPGYSALAAYSNVAGVYNNIAAYTMSYGLGVASAVAKMPTITRGGAIGRLSIPAVGLNRYVYEGTSTASMNKGVAHFESTSGWLGNVAFAGHNRGTNAAFYHLKDVQLGDAVKYTTAYGTLTYVVTSITTVSVNDTSGLLQDGTNKLTMYSCVANQPDIRLCVVATLVG